LSPSIRIVSLWEGTKKQQVSDSSAAP